MTPKQVALVQTSFAKVAPIAGVAADLFYDRLFEMAPDVRRLFPNDLAEQKNKLMTMLGAAVAGLSKPEALLPVMRALGARHAGYGVAARHFAPVGAALIWTLEKGLGEAFTPDMKAAWVEVYSVLSHAMIAGMEPLPKAA